MKRLCVVFCIFLFNIVGVNAQGIVFAPQDWDNVIKQAKSEGKMVFIDCYADWCGPCKRLSKEVFTLDSVGEYINANFISLKYNIENKFSTGSYNINVRALPTLLFYDPNQDSEISILVGAVSAEKLLKTARNAIDGTNTLISYKKAYEGGNMDVDVFLGYIDKLREAHMYNNVLDEIDSYLSRCDMDKFGDKRVWNLYEENNFRMSSNGFRRLWVSRDSLSEIYSKDVVYGRLNCFLSGGLSELVDWIPISQMPSIQTMENYVSFFRRAYWWDKRQWALKEINDADFIRKAEFSSLLNVIESTSTDSTYLSEQKYEYIKTFLPKMKLSEDKKLILRSIEFLDGYINTLSPSMQEALCYIKRDLYIAVGNKSAADRADLQGIAAQKAARK